jgi:hypothetical protein
MSLHVPLPAHGSAGAQSRVGSVDTQTKVHVLVQPSPAVPFLLPSSHSSGEVTMPSPQTPGLHDMLRQIIPVPQIVPASGAGPTKHVCIAVHDGTPMQGSPEVHAPASPGEHSHVQSLVHGSPGEPFLLPSSHCSRPSTTPLPHIALVESKPGASDAEPSDDSPSPAMLESGELVVLFEDPPHPANERVSVPPPTTAVTASQ